MIFSNLVGRCFAPSPTGTEWGTQALQCLPPDPLTRKSYSKVFWLTVRTPLHPRSRPLPRKLWSVKSGIRIPLQSLERPRKQNRTLLLFLGRDDLSLFERKVLYKRPAPVTPRFWTHCVILLWRMERSSMKKTIAPCLISCWADSSPTSIPGRWRSSWTDSKTVGHDLKLLGRQGDSSTRTSEAIVLTMHRTTKVQRQDVFDPWMWSARERWNSFGIRKEIKRVVWEGVTREKIQIGSPWTLRRTSF
jgi:hypothetical protein